MPRRQLILSPQERATLLHWRDHGPKPYQRERAAALLKIADGQPAALVARSALLRPREPDTVYAWLDTYASSGTGGLMTIKPGRGRKPAFSPYVP